jgi:tetratricopeptide (TPR) repeat protein
MLKQFNRFLILAILISIALYITLTNSDQATIKIGPSISLTTYAGVIYMGVFALGCVAASIVALFFGFKGYLRERKLLAAERSRQHFLHLFEKARNLMAGGDWAAARDLWEQVIHRDPENVIARVELSRSLQALGDSHEALRVLDATRASSRSSAEVLFRAAELNRKLGNNTAATDNLGLIISDAPGRKALELARDICAEMGKVNEAIAFQDELDKIGYESEEYLEARRRLRFVQITQNTQSETALREELLTFIKRNPTFAPAMEKLAEIELARGHVEESAELLMKVAKMSNGDLTKWRAVSNLWLNSVQGDFARRSSRAVAAARSATQGTSGRQRLEAELLVIETLLQANVFSDVERSLDSFTTLAERETNGIPADIAQKLGIQRGHYLAQMGKAGETAVLWQELAGQASPNTARRDSQAPREKVIEPSPLLSTP